MLNPTEPGRNPTFFCGKLIGGSTDFASAGLPLIKIKLKEGRAEELTGGWPSGGRVSILKNLILICNPLPPFCHPVGSLAPFSTPDSLATMRKLHLRTRRTSERVRMSVSPLVVRESVANFVRRSTDSLTTRGKLTYGLADGRKNGCPLSMLDSLATRGKLTSGLADGRKKAPFKILERSPPIGDLAYARNLMGGRGEWARRGGGVGSRAQKSSPGKLAEAF